MECREGGKLSPSPLWGGVGEGPFPNSHLPRHLDREGVFEGDFLQALEAALFVPSHANPTGDIRSLVRLNREALENLLLRVKEACEKGASREDVLACLARSYGINLSSMQYVLTHITVSGCIAFLADQGKIAPAFEDGRMLWHVVP